MKTPLCNLRCTQGPEAFVKDGILKKQLKMFRKATRYYTLTANGELKYYVDDVASLLKGTIWLTRSTKVTKKQDLWFEIKTKDKTIVLGDPATGDVDAWIESLQKVISSLS